MFFPQCFNVTSGLHLLLEKFRLSLERLQIVVFFCYMPHLKCEIQFPLEYKGLITTQHKTGAVTMT